MIKFINKLFFNNKVHDEIKNVDELHEFIHEKKKSIDEMIVIKISDDINRKLLIHELRTPINNISMVMMNIEKNVDDKYKEDIHYIKRSLSFIEEIVSKFSQQENGELTLNKLKACKISTIIANVENILFKYTEENISFQSCISEYVFDLYYMDECNIKYCLINLVKNAIKYRNVNHKTEIKVDINKIMDMDYSFITPLNISKSFYCGNNEIINSKDWEMDSEYGLNQTNYETIEITVCDNNEHIPSKIKDNLFSIFNSTSGSGLGLYFCKTFLRLHNGKIEHEFIEPIGNKFIITISLKKVKSKIRLLFDIDTTTNSSSSSDDEKTIISHNLFPTFSSTGIEKKGEEIVIEDMENNITRNLIMEDKERNVLIVDDSSITLKIMRKILLNAVIFDKVYIANNGKEAMEILKQTPNIIMVCIDKNMPIMDGMELALKIRENNYKNLLIGLTGDDSKETIQQFLQNGVDYVLQKPLNENKLSILLDMVMKYI